MNEGIKGVYVAHKKNGDTYFRTSFTFKNKHISIGSFDEIEDASECYKEAIEVSSNQSISINDYNKNWRLAFEKFIIIINFRDNGMYLPNPIYLRKNYFSYYLDEKTELKFSADDLFYYMNHKILKRGGHLYVNDYGMQLNLNSRYGIKNYAVEDKDYRFANGDKWDYRYENIEVINQYQGVEIASHNGREMYKTKIHVVGDVIVGYYDDAIKAAVAYNKAVDTLKKNGINKNYSTNFVDGLSGKVYADIYSEIEISGSIGTYKVENDN